MNICRIVRRDVGPFIDGELTLSRRAAVARHLAVCDSCARLAHAIGVVGETLRGVPEIDLPPFEGLTANVITRVRAEAAQSWTSLLGRAFDDWHWAIVGSGSLAATFASVMVLSLMLSFGPAPARADSLSALMTNLGSPAGVLYACASATGVGQDARLLQIDNGQPVAARITASLMSSPCDATEADLVEALAQAFTGAGGRLVQLDAMHPARREHTEGLLSEIRERALPSIVGRTVAVHQLRLVTGTGVIAKAL
jgi:anti-sigma factor RsiW